MFNQEGPTLGLDISDISLKLMQFEKRGTAYVPAAWSDEAIPKGIVTADKVQDQDALVKIIGKSLASPKFGRLTTNHVVASIPESKSFVRIIHLPKMSEEEAAEAIPWEAEAYIPMPIGQVYLDWVILGEAAGKMTVSITAAPRDFVDAQVTLLKKAGLKPVALEAESQATARSLVAREDEAVMIADINTMRTSLIICNKGVLEFTSSIPIAGDSFTDSIAQALGLDFEAAESLKRQCGLDAVAERGRVRKALIPVVSNLIQEIMNTIRFHEEHSPDAAPISRLLLAGGSAKLRHLPSYLQGELAAAVEGGHPLKSVPNMKVELGNPWVKIIKKGQIPPISREDSLSFATAIGLALRQEEDDI